MLEDKDNVISAEIPEDTRDETFLAEHLFQIFLGMDLEKQGMMINVVGTPPFREILITHHKQAILALANITTMDKDKLFQEYSLTRNRAMLIHDLIMFLDKVKVELLGKFPQAFAPDVK